MRNKNMKLIIGVLIVFLITAIGFRILNNLSSEENIKNVIESTWNEAVSGENPAFLQKITSLSSYEVTSIEKGDKYIINVVVKGVDLGSKLKETSIEKLPQEEDELNEYLIHIIETCEIVETSSVIYAEPLEDDYKIYFTDTFVDAMSGKIYSYYMDLFENVLEE